jgi:hypothetical protein
MVRMPATISQRIPLITRRTFLSGHRKAARIYPRTRMTGHDNRNRAPRLTRGNILVRPTILC